MNGIELCYSYKIKFYCAVILTHSETEVRNRKLLIAI